MSHSRPNPTSPRPPADAVPAHHVVLQPKRALTIRCSYERGRQAQLGRLVRGLDWARHDTAVTFCSRPGGRQRACRPRGEMGRG